MTIKTLTDPDGDRLNFLPARFPPGHVFVRSDSGADSVTTGPFDPADVIAAIREVAEEMGEPAPAPSKSLTAEDFAKAEFARHGGGQIAARVGDDRLAWAVKSPRRVWRSDADMAEESWSIVTPAPTTPREALALAADLAYEPDGDTMPDQYGYMVVGEGGAVNVYSDSTPRGLPARGTGYRLLLLDPPAPVTPARPKGAEEIESQIEEWDHEYGDDAIMTAPRLRELANFLAERGVRVVSGEVEA